jgi:hypothetical protein
MAQPQVYEGEPYCRICYETAETLQNPLIEPCDCKGSLQYVHRKCLLRWAVLNEANPETMCHLCDAPYRGADVRSMERIPDESGVAIFILKYPLVLIAAIHYFLLLLIQNTPRQLMASKFAVFTTFAHILTHYIYLLLFVALAKIQNVLLYIMFWARNYSSVIGVHYILFVLASVYEFETGYLADLWLGMYWYAHIHTLRRINHYLLEGV